MTDRIKVAMVGCGMVSSAYMGAFSDIADRLELIGVLTSTPQSAQKFLAKQTAKCFAATKAYGSIAELVKDKPDFVIVTTPPNTRLELSQELAKAGLPVLMEKPIERNLDTALKIVDLFDEANLPLGIMLQHRTRPSSLALKERLRTSAVGPLRAVEVIVPWWREQSYYEELGRGTYERDGGGVLISQAIHTLDLALQFTGPVAKVTAFCHTTELHKMESEDFVTAGIEFESGAVGSLFASTACYPGRTEEIWLHYEKVSVLLQSALLELHWHDGRKEDVGSAAVTGSGADPMAFTSDWHRLMIEDFIACLGGGKKEPMASGKSALNVHRLIEATVRSGQEGTSVSVR